MDEKRVDVRSWQVGLAGLIVGTVIFAGIVALWRPWEKLPPIGEVRGNIRDADIKQIQKLTAQLTKNPIRSMELQASGEIEVRIEPTLEFFTFELLGGKWTKTSSGYIATMEMPSYPPPPPASIVNHAPVEWNSVTNPVQMLPTPAEVAPAPPSPLPVNYAKVVDKIHHYELAPAAAAPADTPEVETSKECRKPGSCMNE